VKLSKGEHGRSEKVGLNTLANEATFRLIDEALTRGVNLTAVRKEAIAHGSSRIQSRAQGVAT